MSFLGCYVCFGRLACILGGGLVVLSGYFCLVALCFVPLVYTIALSLLGILMSNDIACLMSFPSAVLLSQQSNSRN